MLRELLHSGQVDEASYSSDNALTLTRSETRVRVWDAVTGDMRGELRDDGGIFGARFAADGSNRRISDRSSKGVRIWDAATGAAVRLIADPGGSL
jgi:WD40 repeat protein